MKGGSFDADSGSVTRYVVVTWCVVAIRCVVVVVSTVVLHVDVYLSSRHWIHHLNLSNLVLVQVEVRNSAETSY